MPSNKTHAAFTGLGLGLLAAGLRDATDKCIPHPLLAALGGAASGNIPDLLEPPLHPNHRAFFHSVAFAGILWAALYKAWHWHPENDTDEFLRTTILIVGGAYLAHLACDAFTPKSLPLIGG